MTSSLVGSEMCIRDRMMHLSQQQAMDPRTDALLVTCASDQMLASVRPVSYTHLTLPTICSV
eukprot:7655974-Prorocentrum_lima.AAC.1